MAVSKGERRRSCSCFETLALLSTNGFSYSELLTHDTSSSAAVLLRSMQIELGFGRYAKH
jgi:hypothetical protein